MQNSGNEKKVKLTSLSSEVIPYACYYDSETILTKNCELVGLIKIEEFYSYNSIRDKLQDVLSFCEKTKVALWIQTVRLKAKEGDFIHYNEKEGLSHDIYEDFVKRNNARRKFTNSLYITYVTKSPNIFEGFLKRLSKLFIGFRSHATLTKFLKKERENLEKVKKIFLEVMDEFNVKVIKIRDNLTFPTAYFDFLLSFIIKDYELLPYEIANTISSRYKIAFGHNILHIRDQKNKEDRYAGIISLKEARVPKNMDDVNNMFENEQEFIITETIIFEEDIKKTRAIYEQQLSLLNTSGDEKLKDSIGVSNFEKKNQEESGNFSGFCNRSINILIFEKNIINLDKKIHDMMYTLNLCGFILVRHDIFLENIYYSILPANFAYLKSLHMSTIYNAGLLTDIGDYFSGIITGGYWGKVISGFRTLYNRMNFFNFHGISDTVGHTVIGGYQNNSRSLLRNFLFSQAISKIDNLKIIMIDRTIRSYVFSYAMGGKYLNFIFDKVPKYGINPFAKVNTINGINILKDVLKYIKTKSNESLTEDEIDRVVQNIKSIPDKNNINDIKVILLKENKLHDFVNDPFFDYFIAPEKNFLSNPIEGFNLNITEKNGNYFRFCSHYLLLSAFDISDGSPMIISLSGGLILDHLNMQYLIKMMKKATSLNCTILVLIEEINQQEIKVHAKEIHPLLDTIIFFTSDIERKMAHSVNITEKEMNLIENLNAYDTSFFLKQGTRSTLIKFDMLESKFYPLLISEDSSIEMFHKAISTVKMNKGKWIDIFLELTNNK